MIIGREGNPRAGKTYETVRVDLLEALRRDRKVFARINGLSHEAIATYLSRPLSEVEALLTVMTDADVVAMCICETAADGTVTFPHFPIGSLVIVDECHEFWPMGRADLPAPVVNFFAKHGHYTLDIVLLTQSFKEVHRSVKARMQKNNFYTKLDALGSERSYSVRFYSSPAAGKFELIGSEKRSYDPAIFPLYAGIHPDAHSNPAYDVGTTTLWRTLRWPAIGMAIAVVLGIFFIARFFLSPESTAPGVVSASVKPVASGSPDVYEPFPAAPVSTSAPAVVPPAPVPKPVEVLPPGIAYLLALPPDTRPRYLGEIGGRHLVEWREDGGSQVVERLDSLQLSALGWSLQATGYGLLATYKTNSIVFTPWPVEPRFQQSDLVRRAIEESPPLVSGAGALSGPPLVNSQGATSSGGSLSFGQMARYGDHGVAPPGTNSITR